MLELTAIATVTEDCTRKDPIRHLFHPPHVSAYP
jgi:hypothetical protein